MDEEDFCPSTEQGKVQAVPSTAPDPLPGSPRVSPALGCCSRIPSLQQQVQEREILQGLLLFIGKHLRNNGVTHIWINPSSATK